MKATFWIGISGSKTMKPEEVEKFELKALKEARRFVGKLEGVQTAECSLGSGIVDLTKEEPKK